MLNHNCISEKLLHNFKVYLNFRIGFLDYFCNPFLDRKGMTQSGPNLDLVWISQKKILAADI